MYETSTKTRFAAWALVLLALTGSILYSAPAEAAQGLCWTCIYLWFNGFYCDANHGPAGDCVRTGTTCQELGECTALTVITD